ncbi:hypothetical protein [Nisaea sp.]|uniref:hypothetical protein n=1 Tax=Nisaea sp. TaxID=2024842 RepID=UPI00326484F4
MERSIATTRRLVVDRQIGAIALEKTRHIFEWVFIGISFSSNPCRTADDCNGTA